MRTLLLALLPIIALGACNRQDDTGNTAVVPPGFHPPTALNRTDFYDMITQRFSRLDTNHDLYLSPQEYPERHRDIVKSFDTDGDGRVSKIEFTQGSLKLFDEADTNHDGVLTGDEKRAAWLDRKEDRDSDTSNPAVNETSETDNNQ